MHEQKLNWLLVALACAMLLVLVMVDWEKAGTQYSLMSIAHTVR